MIDAYHLQDLMQRLTHMVRTGTISAIDTARPFAKVKLGSGDNVLETDWLPIAVTRAGNDKTWWPLEIGETVVLLSESGDLDNAIVFGSVNSTDRPAPSSDPDVAAFKFDDGAVVQYDRKNHTLKADLPDGGKAEITATGGIKLIGNVELTGALAVSETIAATKSISSQQNVSDSKSSMDSMRNTYNNHTAPTSTTKPTQQMT